MVLISVIVPIYKVEKYLDCCIQSIVNQTYRNLEIILVEDGSPDGCADICDMWAEKDSRIKVIHKENGGLSEARNVGLKISTGEYISFVDSDDRIEPDFLKQLYGGITAYNADVAECAVSYVDENGHFLRHRNAAQIPEMGKLEALRRLVLEEGIYQTVWNKLYSRKAIEGIFFEVGKFHEDEFWTYRVFDKIEKLTVVQEFLYNYLQRSSSIIGAGYNIRRLDGLEARYLRMIALQKYEALAGLTQQTLIMDCLWHYQSASQALIGEEKRIAQERILQITKDILRVSQSRQKTGKLTEKIWRTMFVRWPNLTIWIRNRLGIGG